jgi:uncharacterized protein (DUF1684 family)
MVSMAQHDPDHPDDESVGLEAYADGVLEVRQEKDAFFASSADSPIPAHERAGGFQGLRYYPPDVAYRVEATVSPQAQPETVWLGSTKGDLRPQMRYAELRFTLSDEPCRLLAFKDPAGELTEPGELFIPFRDATSGTETYGAGRYLETEEHEGPDGARFAVLDFNLAYSPWCAYNEAYSCILPPPENRLSVSVRAGERTYHEDL